MNYNDFISTILESRGRFLNDYDGVKERHHIIMRSLGGSDDESNLIDLIDSEHYLAHKLLALENPECREAQIAWGMMSHNKDANGRTYEVSADDWELSRKLWIKAFSGENHPNFGKLMSEEQKAKISKTRIEKGLSRGDKNYFYGKRFCGKDNYWYGKKIPDDARAKMSAAKKEYFKTHDGINKGKTPSKETRGKISASLKGKMGGGKHPNAKPVICEGIVYDYIGACADYYDVNKKTMQSWLRLGTVPTEWQMLGLAYYNNETGEEG